MATTIQVKDTTMQLLKSIKHEAKAKSYDDVIIALANERRQALFKSMRGTLKGDWDIMEDLRDKHDRY
jgi:predicted CopG family antitoxin